MTSISVLSSSNYAEAERALGRPITEIRDLADLAHVFGSLHNGEHQLWVHGSAHRLLSIPDELPAGTGHEGFQHGFAPHDHREPAGLAPFMRVAPTDNRYPRVAISFAAWDHAAGLERAEPYEISAAVTIYEDLLGTTYTWSPGATGIGLMLKGRRQLLGPSTTSPPEPMVTAGTERDLSWWRGLWRGNEAGGFIHVYDAAARYLASCSSLELGRGEPARLEAHVAGERLSPGYYDVTLSVHMMTGPDPLGGEGRRWITHPTMELAEQLGRVAKLHAGVVWRDHARHLDPWATTIRRARAQLQPEKWTGGVGDHRELALGMLKRTYTMAIGSLAGGWREPGDVFYRPDWRHAVIAASRVNLWRRARKAGVLDRLVGVEVDALYVWSSEAEPYPELLFGSRESLGGMGFVATVPAADVAEDLMSSSPPWSAFRDRIAHPYTGDRYSRA